MSSRPEPEWDEQEQAWMLALGQWRASQCSGCGRHLPDTTDPEAEEEYVAETYTCHACAARSVEAQRFAEDPHPTALRIVTKRR